MKKDIENFIAEIDKKNSQEPEFMQAVREVAETVIPYIVSKKKYITEKIF